jgi:hypothetical protein
VKPLKWTRSEKVIGRTRQISTGESIYTSTCGRFVIHQQRWGSRVWYLLDVDGARAPGWARERDTLAHAKCVANLIHNPDYEG